MEVRVIEGGRKAPEKPKPEGRREAALKRIAMQIALQLPSDSGEADRVLDHAKTIVRTFLARHGGASVPS